jgi:hypothetical protein
MLSHLENGDELPNCFLERSRLGRPLPCAIRLRTQRSNHLALAVLARWHGLTRGVRTKVFTPVTISPCHHLAVAIALQCGDTTRSQPLRRVCLEQVLLLA